MREVLFLLLLFVCVAQFAWACTERIDRHSLVTRHNVRLTGAFPIQMLQVGNGEIAFGTDATGLQTFKGDILSHWGWHTEPLPDGLSVDDFEYHMWDVHGRSVPLRTKSSGQKELYNWLRENPHRLNLGRISLKIDKSDQSELTIEDIAKAERELNLWHGIIESNYEVEGKPVKVLTCADPVADAIAVSIESPLIKEGRLSVVFSFPYGNPTSTHAADWSQPDRHSTTIVKSTDDGVVLKRVLDEDNYEVALGWSSKADLKETSKHFFELKPSEGAESLEFTCEFRSSGPGCSLPKTFEQVRAASASHWQRFWETGGAIDLSESKDERWKELERRIVLSQYLEAVNEAGSLPPQESGLLLNSGGWSGKFHVEVHWFHETHFALWDRWPLFERSLGWYKKILPSARRLAEHQGYRGVRWPKMTGPEGRDSPSAIGPLLIWQQPHPIYYAEMDYRLHPSRETLEKWQEIVEESAEFMASYAWRNPETGKYDLGPPMNIAAEATSAAITKNPTFELSYWRYGLRKAQQWRERLGLERKPEWDEVLNNLAPLPVENGLYVFHEGIEDMWTRKNWGHPDVLGPATFLPEGDFDMEVMLRTLDKVMQVWRWETTWGWDYGWIAMAAARCGRPDVAIEALLHPNGKNSYDETGVCRGGPVAVYFPGNGSLLYAVAMMAGGWDGCPERDAPGFPDDGSWTVKWEGLKRAQ